MTIRETVKAIVCTLPGNKPVDIFQRIIPHNEGASKATVNTDTDELEWQSVLSTHQIRRALRDIPYVKRVNGKYIVKGRRVPAKLSTNATDN